MQVDAFCTCLDSIRKLMMCTYLFFFIILEQSLWKQPNATHDPDSPQQQQQQQKKKKKKKEGHDPLHI